ncbi:MAG: DUF4238 domain-containing protein [Chloroflexi bacterium]|nr:DUF4238 domain-containing protein [Chloroflexota bacterium]
MSKIKFQHYVPRFYLEGYADLSGMVWVFDKVTKRIFSTKPKNIAGENYYYDVPGIESLLGLDQPLEKSFWQHESEASKLIKYLDGIVFEDDFPSFHLNNRQVLAMHIVLQIMRVPKYRELLFESINLTNDGDLELIKALSNEDERAIHAFIFMQDEMINNWVEILADQIWTFARNTTVSPFYTSDNPVLFKTKDSKFWTPPKNLIEDGVQIIFPLSPDIVLYIVEKTYFSSLKPFDGKLSPVEFTKFMVDHENSGQVGMCKRFIFSCRNDFAFAKEYLDSNPRVHNPD